MTEKQKAQELITEYRFLLSLPGAPLGDNKDHVAKECALHTVNTLLNELDQNKPSYRYWLEVKTELENYPV